MLFFFFPDCTIATNLWLVSTGERAVTSDRSGSLHHFCPADPTHQLMMKLRMWDFSLTSHKAASARREREKEKERCGMWDSFKVPRCIVGTLNGTDQPRGSSIQSSRWGLVTMASVPSLAPISPSAFLPSCVVALPWWHYAIICQMQQLLVHFPLSFVWAFQSYKTSIRNWYNIFLS